MEMYNRNIIENVSKMGVLPSYLECFERNKVHLMFAKKPSLSSDIIEECKKEIVHDETVDECELTGSPLKVDLGDNDTFLMTKIEEPIQRWSADESKHFPLSTREARRELNRILKNVKPDLECSLPTYIVCSADDAKKTVLLGGNSKDFMTCSVHVLGIVQLCDVEKKIEEMVDEHLRNCFNNNGQVNYLVKITYNLYGMSLRNVSCQNVTLRERSTYGNAYVDIVSPKKIFKISETDEGNMKMYLEVVAGHKLLTLNFLWNELVILQTLISILTDSMVDVSDETIICETPLNQDVILQSILELLSSKSLRRVPEKNIVNLDHLRQEDLLDGLWRVLIRCENVSILRDSFNFLFEELADGSIRVLHIKDDCSKVSTIIRGILQGKIGLSTLSLSESVVLLFELGAQKLKFDFQVILTQFLPHVKTTIDSIWKESYHEDLQDIRKSRRTKVTNHVGKKDTVLMTSKLAYLSQLYIGSEFIYLLKEQVDINDDGFRHFCRCVEKEYVSDANRIRNFNDIFESPLNEMSFELDFSSASFIQSAFPSRWNITLETGRETTIYDLSDSPIFPTVIYEYDVPLPDTGDMHYYISKMSRSTGLF